MPLSPYFPNCFRRGTSWHESGNKINIVPRSGELVKLFVIDPESNPQCSFRQITGLSGPICDVFITFLSQEHRIQLICLIEMKGNDLDYAIQQISKTYEALTQYHEDLRRANYRGYILSGGSAPIILNTANRNLLNRIFGRGNFTIRRKQNNDDLGQFLRRTCTH